MDPQNYSCLVLSKVSAPRDAEPWAVAFIALWLERTASLARALALHVGHDAMVLHTSGLQGSTILVHTLIK